MSQTDDVTAIARATYEAYEKKDRAALEALISDDFHFTSPIDNRLDREVYLETCWQNSEVLERFDLIYMVPQGERVFVTYEAHNKDGSSSRNTEILTVRDGKLVEVEVYFGWPLPHKAALNTHLSEDGQ